MLKKLSGLFLAMMLLTALFAGLITAEAKTLLQITEQPVSATAPAGSVATVSFEAEGEGLKYSWYYKNAGASKFTRTTSFTGNTYSVAMNSSRNGRQIYCVVTDSDGNTVQTNTVKLNMGNPLEITKQPVNKTAASGKTVKVSFSASGDGLTYKWYYKDAGKTSFSLTNTFKSNSYSVTMTDARNGRQLYCVVTDKYGNSVKTDTVTISITGSLAITSQPKSVAVPCGDTAKVSFTATGEGLTYKWYYKNASGSRFVATSTFKSNSYSVAMNSSRDGRQIYCVVTDKNGKTVQTDTVTLTAKHSFDSGKAEKKLTCTSDGVTLFTCNKCGFKKTETIKAEGHKLGSWKVILEPTVTSKGTERRSCQNCSYYKDRSIEMQTAVYTIKADYGNGNIQEIGVGANGAYKLSTPKNEGYTFMGWKDSLGNSFPSSGYVKKNIEISAEWEIEGTNTISELVRRAAAGTDTIVITGNITVNQPIYVPYNTTIYTDGEYSLTRAPSYNGDFFVVGKDKNGTPTVNLNKKAVLTLGGGKGTLTVDGNKENTTVDVVGTLIFAADSSEVNLFDGVILKNNRKTGNKRINTYSHIMAEETRFRVGGAAIISFSSTVNMYGGIIEDNEVSTEYTEKTDAEGIITKHEYNGCGGGVYNRGMFNMHGGEIRDNLALRGGGVYTDRASFFYAGKISGNMATAYGAAISTSSTQNADTFIGTDYADAPKMIIENNHALRAGGAVYSNTSSPIIIYGNTEFINNRTDSSGGAIYTAGPLTIRGTVFKGNSCEYSGGAIYHHYTKLDFTPRNFKMENCTFEENSGGLGAAVILSANGTEAETGTNATISNCEFIRNHAVKTSTNPGNGGAIYVTRKSSATITDCNFTENTANTNAGAVAIHSEANVTLKNIDFNGNSATFGGGIYTSSDSVVKLTDIDFINNSAVLREDGTGGNGGALNISGGSKVTLKTVSFEGNTAGNNAGAVYLNATNFNVDSSCTFKNNTAGNHGGVFYLTYRTNEDQTKTGSVLTAKDVIFENNSALSGGAISARSASTLNLTNVRFLCNSTPDAKVSTSNGGGAVYSNNSAVNIVNSEFDGNLSGYYGGALKLDSCDTVITDSSIKNSSGGTGGAVYSTAGTFTAEGLSLTGNKAGLNGVMFMTKNIARFNNLTASGNTSVNAGVVFASTNSDVKIEDSHITDNTAKYGGAVYVTGKGTVSVTNTEFTANSSTSHGGAVYLLGASFNASESTVFTENTAGAHGGAVSAHDEVKEGTLEKILSHVTLKDCTFTKNTGSNGGGVYFNDTEYEVSDCSFTENTALSESYGGGAVYNTGAKGSIRGVTFTKNKALRGGAVAIYTNSEVSFSDITATENEATEGGVIYSNKLPVNLTNGKTVLKNNKAVHGGAVYATGAPDVDILNAEITGNTSEKNGGAIYVSGGTLDITGKENIIANNSAGEYGGAVYASYVTVDGVKNGCVLSVTETDLTDNTALYGGAVAGRTNTVLNFSSMALRNNKTADATMDNSAGGGAVYINNATLNFSDVDIDSNMSGYYGGAVYAAAADITMKDGTTVTGNTGGTGAAMYITSGSTLAADGLTLKDNTSSANGIIYMNGKSFVFNGLTATGNFSDYSGGALYFSGKNTKGEINNSHFENNEASSGGAVAVKGATIEINDGTFIKNISDNTAGALLLQAGHATINGNTVFEKNTAASHGGAVYVTYSENDDKTKNPSSLTMNGGEFLKNSAFAGGAVSSRTDCTVSLTGTVLKENTVTSTENTEGGGAVFTNYNTLTLSGVTLEGNTSPYYGGAVTALGAEVTIKDNTVIKANLGKTGAAVNLRSGGTCTITDSSVTDHDVTGGSGVVYITGNGKLDVKGLTAENNINTNGAVIYSSGSATVNVSTSHFTSNTAKSIGGAIDFRSTGVLTVTNSEFTENTAKNGGAVHLEEGSAVITGCIFDKNSTTSTGGAVHSENATAEISGCTFTENASTSNGGAVYMKLTEALLENSTFEGNTTENCGGAIDLVAANLTATGNNTFTKNTATNHAGAIYLTYIAAVPPTETEAGSDAVYSTLNMTDGIFTENTAMGGGAVSIRTGSEATFTNTEFLKNSVEGFDEGADNTGEADGDGEGGGAIYVGYGKLNLNNTVFTENTASGFGGAVDVLKSEVKVTGGTFNKNTANDGGAVYAIGKSDITFNGTTLSENESTFENTEYDSSVGGGAVNMFGGTLTMTGVTLENNKTDYYGGAVMTNNVRVTIDGGSSIKGNTGSTGAALNFKNGSVVNISNTEITENTSVFNGVIYINTGSLTATNITATKNSGKNSALFYISNKSTVVTVTDSTLSENTATNGAAAYVDSASINISGTEITGNSATNGGVLYLIDAEASLTGVTATENGNKYGAVVFGENAALTVTDSEITKNTGTTGGAVNLKGDSVLTVTNTVISENTGTSGGAVYMDGGTAFYDGVTVSKNTATGNGGALYHKVGTVTVKDTVFTENTSALNGGAIMNSGSVITVTGNSEFTENSAKNHGGAVYNTYIAKVPATETTPEIPAIPSDFNMTDGKCIGNSALAGGVISIRTGCNANFTNTVLTDNTVQGFADKADGDGEGGGAVYVGFGTLTLENVTASGNKAEATVNEQDGTTAYGFGGVVDSYHSTVTVNGGTFENNSASVGGAIHALKSESITVTGASFRNNNSVTSKVDASAGGGAILVKDSTLTASGTVFEGNTTGYYGAAVHSINSDVTIDGDSVIKNHKGSTGAALYFRENSVAVLEDTEVSGNTANGNGVIYINTGSLTVNNITATNNNGKNSALFYASNKSTVVNVTDSTLSGNTATNGGVAFIDASTLNITGTEITGNSAENGGAIYLKAKAIVNLTNVTASDNSAEYGGFVYEEDSTAIITDSSISGNTATKNGGAVYGENSSLTVTGSEITENTGTSGGAVYMNGGLASYDGVTLSKNEATSGGGAIYHRNSPATIKDSVFTENQAGTNGGAIMNSGSVITVTGNSEFTENSAKNHGGAVYNTYIAKVPATETTPEIPAVYSDFNMTDGKCIGNSALAGGVISIRTGCNASFTNTVLTDNTVAGYADTADGDGEGGGAVYVGFGTLTFNNVTASGNKAEATVNEQDGTAAYGFGGVVDSYHSTVAVNGGTFENNSATAGGVIHALDSDNITVTNATFRNNSSLEETSTTAGGGAILVNGSTLAVSGTVFDGNTTAYYGAAVHSMDSKVTINGNSVIKNHKGTTGAALYFRDGSEAIIENTEITDNTAKSNGVVYANMSKLTMKNVTASGNEAASGGAVFVSGTKTAEISDSTFTGNTAKYGGALYTNGPDIILTNSTLSGNTANLGGALFNKLGEVTISGVTFENNKAVKNASGSDGNGGAVNLTGGTLTAVGDNTFTGNTAEGFGGAVYNSYANNDDGSKTPGVLNMTDGLFTGNTASSGGAVAARTNCVSTFTGTDFTSNSATSTVSGEGGGAVYGNNNTITLTGVTMDGNSSGYYGGAVLTSASDITINGGSVITNTSGKTGAVLCFRSGTTATLENITVENNKASAGSGLIYATGADTTLNAKNITVSGNESNHGAFYISGSAVVTITDSTIINNKANNNGGAINHHSAGLLTVTNTTFSGNSAKNGGAVSTEENGPALFTGCTFTGNTATEKGGVLCLGGSKDVTLRGCTINGNSASVSGGAIYTNGTGKLIISENTALTGNEAPNGVALHVDMGAVAEITASTLKGNNAANNGGAVYITDLSEETNTAETTLVVTNTVFEENIANSKGGAISTGTSAPNLRITANGCTFLKNSATTAGGGAVEIQNGNCTTADDPTEIKIVFTNCTFTENKAKTTGCAIEIRTSSMAKVDGITATKHTTTQNGAVFYVTSNHSRLYLTGTVTESENSAKNGNFAYLYKVDSYSNPPRIYTSHSKSDATWYSGVAGNKTAVTFDVAVMP